MPADNAGKTAALAGAYDVDILLVGKDIDQHPVSGLDCNISLFAVGHRLNSLDTDFLDNPDRRHVVLGEVALLRPGQLGGLDKLHQANLGGVVAVLAACFQLRDDAGTCLQHRDRVHIALIVKHLRHADFLTENACDCHRSLPHHAPVLRALPVLRFLALPATTFQTP